jgi:hypothetical protein
MTDVVVALPKAMRNKAIALNVISSTALAALSFYLTKQSAWLGAGVFLVFSLIAAIRLRGLLRNQHVALIDGVLHAYEPHRGGSATMPVAEIASIQQRAGSDRNLVKLPNRYLVRHNRSEREMEIYLLDDSQGPKLDAFFREHFPEQYQEPVSHLPGFPPPRK